MSRRRRAVKRVITPDPVYHDKNMTTFINKLMLDGKKSKAESIFTKLLILLQKKQTRNLWKLLIWHCKMLCRY